MSVVDGRVPGREARAGKFNGPSLIPSLNVIQREHGWLPREELVRLSRETRRPLYEIEGLISFYPHFRVQPPPRVEVTVCRDLSCWLHGGEEQIAQVHARYGDDVEIEVREVSCIGRCDIAPAATVAEQPVRAAEVPAAVERARATGEADEIRRPEVRTWPNDPYAGRPAEARYATARAMIAGELDGDHAIAALKESGLRGMGGAGFPTGSKWELVAAQQAEPKFVICNADESEPGTFKDRQILMEQPHLVIEGMLVGMLAIGAEQGWVFIRHEYGPEEEAVRAELDRARAAGLLGPDVLDSGRPLEIDVFTSPGGYILGEESALIECMEGHRGEPRNKPPFPGVSGLWGKPTLMNSVETFAAFPIIEQRGAQWWKDQGANGGDGLKFIAVSGHIANPDVYCVPMGTTARELIELAGGMAGGATLQAFQPGGSSSNFLGPEHLDVPLDFKSLADAGSMLGSGAVVVIDDQTDLLAAATNVLRFFRNESCGKCVPCRVGSHKAHTILTNALAEGLGVDGIDSRIDQLEETLRMTSICGLGQVALGPVMSVLRRGRAGAPPLSDAMAATGREFFTAKTVAEALADFRPAHRTATETVALDDAAGRIPAVDILAGEALPGFDRSSVDGYAVRAQDTFGASESIPAYLTLTGSVAMGASAEVALLAHSAIAVPTGGALPAGADAVVMIEYTQEAMAGTIEVVRPVAPGEGIVRADEDMAPGQAAVPAGAPLRAQDIAMLAALGITELQVCARPAVTILATGDELIAPDAGPVGPGQVRDALSSSVGALVREAGGRPHPPQIVGDDPGALHDALDHALADSDMVVICAGSSVGARDETAAAVAAVAGTEIWCHGLAIKPGKPTLLAASDGIPIIGLPGNPRSALVVFRLIGTPLVRRAGGWTAEHHAASIPRRLSRDLPSAAGRLDVVQVRLWGDEEAEPIFGPSALLSVLTAADGYVIVPEDANGLPAGETLEVFLYR